MMNAIKKIVLPLIGFILLTIIGVGLWWNPIISKTEQIITENLLLFILVLFFLLVIVSLVYFIIRRSNIKEVLASSKTQSEQVSEKNVEHRTTSNSNQLEEDITFKMIFDNIGDLICVIDRNFNVVRINQSWLDTFNLSKEETIGKKCYKVFYRREQLCQNCPAITAFKNGKVIRMEKSTITADGKIEYFDVQAIPNFNREGNVIQVINYAKDITEQEEKQEKIRKANSQFKSIIEAIPDIIYFRDSKTGNVIANKAYNELIGTKEKKSSDSGQKTEEVDPNSSLTDILSNLEAVTENSEESLYKRWEELDKKVMEEGKTIHLEEKFVDKDGKERFLDTIKTPFYDKQNKIIGVIGISRDITENKEKSMQRLENIKAKNSREAAKFSNLLSDINELVLFTDKNDRVVDINNNFAQFIGKERQNILGKSLFTLYSENGAEENLREVIKRFHNASGCSPVDIKHSSPQGEVDLRIQPIYNAEQYEGSLLIANKPESKKQLKVDEFTNLDENDKISVSAPNDMRAPIRIETDKLGIEIMDFDIETNIKDMSESLVKKVYKERTGLALELKFRVPDTLSEKDIEERILNQVVLNIVWNVIKFTEEGVADIRMNILPK